MDYRFLDMNDEELLEGASRPLVGGVSLGLLTTGYDIEQDEVLSISVVDMQGTALFSKTVKPHNIDTWEAGAASGGIGPSDVEEAPALYELEDELSAVLENVEFIVTEHFDFVKAMLDRSWIALPKCTEVDLVELFRLSHGTADYPDEPATVATTEAVCAYYDVTLDASNADEKARSLMKCYRCIVEEFESHRAAKGEEYWKERERRRAEEAAARGGAMTVEQMRERRYTQMNALLWVAGGIIFTSLVIQLYQRGADIGLMIIAGAAAAFAFFRAIANWPR